MKSIPDKNLNLDKEMNIRRPTTWVNSCGFFSLFKSVNNKLSNKHNSLMWGFITQVKVKDMAIIA